MIFNSLGSNYDFNFVIKSLSSFFGNPKDLEKLLVDKYGGKVSLVYKGSEAIELSLKLLNLPKESFVAINGFTCFAVYEAIKKAGLNVEYLDIERGKLNFSADTLNKTIQKNAKIKVVIVQNTLGYPCEIEEISKVCKENRIILIEDLAHSIGTKYENGKQSGTIGDITILSFSQDKIIDGVSGGALITKRQISIPHLKGVAIGQQIIDRFYPFFTFFIRKFYPIGLGKLLHFVLKKLNLLSKPMGTAEIKNLHNLPNWYANLIKNEFSNLERNLVHRKKIASIYSQSLNPKIISKAISEKIDYSSNLRFPIFVEKREGLIKYLEDNVIYVSDIWYDAPIAPKKYLPRTDYNKQCPNSELASSAILNLPTHINVSEKDAKEISNHINQWLKSQ